MQSCSCGYYFDLGSYLKKHNFTLDEFIVSQKSEDNKENESNKGLFKDAEYLSFLIGSLLLGGGIHALILNSIVNNSGVEIEFNRIVIGALVPWIVILICMSKNGQFNFKFFTFLLVMIFLLPVNKPGSSATLFPIPTYISVPIGLTIMFIGGWIGIIISRIIPNSILEQNEIIDSNLNLIKFTPEIIERNIQTFLQNTESTKSQESLKLFSDILIGEATEDNKLFNFVFKYVEPKKNEYHVLSHLQGIRLSEGYYNVVLSNMYLYYFASLNKPNGQNKWVLALEDIKECKLTNSSSIIITKINGEKISINSPIVENLYEYISYFKEESFFFTDNWSVKINDLNNTKTDKENNLIIENRNKKRKIKIGVWEDERKKEDIYEDLQKSLNKYKDEDKYELIDDVKMKYGIYHLSPNKTAFLSSIVCADYEYLDCEFLFNNEVDIGWALRTLKSIDYEKT